MTQPEVDLASVFQAVTQTLAENKTALNRADEYNRDHGTNMVKTFKTITTALEKKKGASDSEALQYAARQLSKKAASGSAKAYAQNLNQAAERLQGKSVDERGAMELLQMLIGGGQAAPQPSHPAAAAGGDLLGSLLGGMAGGGGASNQAAGGDLLGALLGGMAGGESSSNQPASGDLLGSLLGGMAGGGGSSNQSAGGDLLGALLGGLAGGGSSSGGGGSLLGTLAQAFLGSSNMGQTTHRNQSTMLVIQAFLKALGALKK